jgi:hypothetical protein
MAVSIFIFYKITDQSHFRPVRSVGLFVRYFLKPNIMIGINGLHKWLSLIAIYVRYSFYSKFDAQLESEINQVYPKKILKKI